MAKRVWFPRLAMLAAALMACGLNAQEGVRLPDLGSSADALISPQDAQDYGAAMLRQMRSLGLVLDDPLVNDYINDLGYRLVAASERPREHFSFFVAKDDVINAFAAPGGYIAVNSGLIALTRNEDELAGVIAHEIGHITQNHLQRAFEDSKKSAPLMALILLGAIAAGSGAHSGDSSAAVLMGGQGLLMQREINFTRKDEIEADRVGIQTLANAGFDPHAMASFFDHMQDTLRVGMGDDLPSMLQDHPVFPARISDANARADALAARQKLRPTGSTLSREQWEKATAPVAYLKDPSALLPRHDHDGLDTYALIRERVRVLSGDPARLADYYARNLAEHAAFDTPANRYGYALALTLSNRGEQALTQLAPLLAGHPDSLLLQLAQAEAMLQAGHRAEALTRYAELNARSPRNHAVALAYAKALSEGGSREQAASAAALLRPLLDDSDEPDMYRTYARASERAGDSVRAGEAYADASYLSGRPFDALEQLKRLLRRDDLDYYARARIQGRIAQLTPLVMELRKRKIPTEDNPDAGSPPPQLRAAGCDTGDCVRAR